MAHTLVSRKAKPRLECSGVARVNSISGIPHQALLRRRFAADDGSANFEAFRFSAFGRAETLRLSALAAGELLGAFARFLACLRASHHSGTSPSGHSIGIVRLLE
mmetsp:Transcript_26338/g.87280  ORF Transcript_26338/g.87280 Transcript_26338/m.87280 type:complete len:105 (-) Transcript_26338:554-868(-)